LVDLVRVHPVSDIQLTQIRVTVLIATDVPFVVQFIGQPAWFKAEKVISFLFNWCRCIAWRCGSILIPADRARSWFQLNMIKN
jgi:hypothetical protein